MKIDIVTFSCDSSPMYTDILRMKDIVDVILYHDSEEPSYGWKHLKGHFSSVYDYDMFSVKPTVVSNKYDLQAILL